MPTIRANNAIDPSQIADMFNPLAKAFAPPTGQEILAGAKARETAQRVKMVQDLYDAAGSPGYDQAVQDRRAIAAGLYNPNQSFYSVDQGNATTLKTSAADNARALQQTGMQQAGENARNANTVRGNTVASLYGALNQGQVRPEVPADVARLVGLPGIAAAQGLPKAPSTDEVAAQALLAADPSRQLSVAMKGVGITAVQKPDGSSEYVPNDQAQGRAPAPTDFKPQIFNYQLPNGGGSVPVRTGADGALYSTQGGQKVADGGQTFSSNLTGSKEQTGLGGATANSVDQKIMDIKALRTTAQQYKALLQRDPGSVGIVGTVRGLSQDVAATAREAGAMLPGLKQKFEREVAAGNVAPEVLKDLMPNGTYNANIPQAKMLQLLLASQFAKFLDPNGRISNDRMNQVSASLGHGSVLSNVDQTNANLDGMLQMLDTQEKYLVPTRPETAKAFGVGGVADAASAAPVTPGQPVRRKWTADGQLQ